jgi:TolB protein
MRRSGERGRKIGIVVVVVVLVVVVFTMEGVEGKLVLENVRQLTFVDVHSIRPQWCPDGSIVYYTTNIINYTQDAIYKIENPTSTTPNIKVLEPVSNASVQPSCGPDGMIVFASNRSHSLDQLYIMDSDGSSQRRITNSSMEEFAPSWSPDGRKIVFVGVTKENADIWIVDVDGSNLTRLTTWPSFENSPSWSPDGQNIVFVSDRSGQDDIWIMNADGSNKRRVITQEAGFPSWSRDGKRISYVSGSGTDVGIWVMDLYSGQQTLLVKYGMTSDWREDNKIAFSKHVGDYQQIFIADVVEVPDFDLFSLLAGMVWVLFVGIPLGLTLIYIAIIVRGKLRRRDER